MGKLTGYSYDGLMRIIEAAKKNITIFKEAIAKEEASIKDAKGMIDHLDKVQEQIKGNGDNNSIS
jgi:hypothetical protein